MVSNSQKNFNKPSFLYFNSSENLHIDILTTLPLFQCIFIFNSFILTTWNFTCKHMDRFLSPAVPDIKVLLMLPTLLREVDPSIPTMEPLTIPPTGAFTLLNNSLMLALKQKTFSNMNVVFVDIKSKCNSLRCLKK